MVPGRGRPLSALSLELLELLWLSCVLDCVFVFVWVHNLWVFLPFWLPHGHA